MNYKAHIPAGVMFAGLFSLIMGWVAVIPVLIGGAVGGALPDIDTEGAAIEKMGAKSATAAQKTIGKMGNFGKMVARMMEAVGSAIDLIFLAPLGKLWRFLSKNVFGRIYLAIYHIGSFGPDNKCLGEVLHWNGDSKPWTHRGGITHSFTFMVTSCVFTVPIAFIFQSPEFLLGAELGIVSHLVADSFCKSGVKFFFPFQPKIGFDNENGAGRGRDIRLLPKGMQVSTGKDRITNSELDNYTDQDKAMKDRKLRFREKMWQWIFKLGALVCLILLVVGFAGRAGGIAFSAPIFGGEPAIAWQIDTGSVQLGGDGNSGQNGGAAGQDGSNVNAASKEGAAFQASGNENIDDDNTPAANNEGEENSADNDTDNDGNGNANGNESGAQFDVATAGSTATGVNPYIIETKQNRKPEVKGPTSLTKGDISIRQLPKGIMKMPDESLWIIGVGPVSRENLDNNDRWRFTDEEKETLLRAASAQRFADIPNSVSSAFVNATQAIQDTAQEVTDAAQGSAGGIQGMIEDATGVDLSKGSGYGGGFLGITTWTDS